MGGEVVARFVLVAQVVQHVDYAALVKLRDVACQGEVGKEEDADGEAAGERGARGKERG